MKKFIISVLTIFMCLTSMPIYAEDDETHEHTHETVETEETTTQGEVVDEIPEVMEEGEIIVEESTASTQAETEPTLYCDKQEHIHNEDCFDNYRVLICEEKDLEHIHEEECYKTYSFLMCEKEEHIHDDNCLYHNNEFDKTNEQNRNNGLQLQNMAPAQFAGFNPSATIALLDTGVGRKDTYNQDHIISRVSYIENNEEGYDDNGHGDTMYEYILDEAPTAKILSIKVLDNKGKGTYENLINGILYATQQNVDIISMSLSSYDPEGNNDVKNAIQNAVDQGIIVIVAAGNDGRDVQEYVPASIAEAITVGAAKINGTRHELSNYGNLVDYNVIANSTSEATARMTGIVYKNGLDYVNSTINTDKVYEPNYIPSGGSATPIGPGQDPGIIGEITIPTNVDIVSLSNEISKGATLTNGKWIKTPTTSNKGQKYVFRVNYSTSGVGETAKGGIRFTVPKSILKDRNGNLSDTFEVSVPHEDEWSESDNVDFVYYTEGNNIVLYNIREVSAAVNGYFEVAYLTNKTTYQYADMQANNPFNVIMSVGGKTQAANEIFTYLNTQATIKTTTKEQPVTLHRSWENSWGSKPENADDYYYLQWRIITDLGNDITQPYTFTINDSVLSEGEVVGYKFAYQNSYSSQNSVTYQNIDGKRYDYVLTKHLKSNYDENREYWIFKNQETAIVTPIDGFDEATNKTATREFRYRVPRFTVPVGHFNQWKHADGYWRFNKEAKRYGITSLTYLGNKANEYSRYDLETLKEGEVEYLENFDYAVFEAGYPYPWTYSDVSGNGPLDPNNYGILPVKYVLEDNNEMYLENIKLEAGDYQIDHLSFGWTMKDGELDENELVYELVPATYTDTDIVVFYGNFGDGNMVKIGTYNLKTKEYNFNSNYIVKTEEIGWGGSIRLYPADGMIGYKLETENAHYFTQLDTVPNYRLIGSSRVKNIIQNVDDITLTNKSHGYFYENDGTKILQVDTQDENYARIIERNSDIQKKVVSSSNNPKKKNYTIGWRVTMNENYTIGDGQTHAMEQESGIFYDLLPMGGSIDLNSVAVQTENGYLSDNAYVITTTPNYRNSGRTLLVVQIKEAGLFYNLYYDTVHGWDAIKDYGDNIYNPVAYETGNKDIAKGFNDDGGSIHDKELLSNLDPNTNAKKFIYSEIKDNISAITSALSGLNKKVKTINDNDYLYTTTTVNNGYYQYRLRYMNSFANSAKNLVYFDDLENYKTPDGEVSDWHGTLQAIDVQQLKDKGIDPKVYIKTEYANLDQHDSNSNVDIILSGWELVNASTDLSQAKAVAIDMRKDTEGNDYELAKGDSISAILYMKAPNGASDNQGGYPETYNNIYIYNTVIGNLGNEETFYIHQDYTTVSLIISQDIKLHKASSDDININIPNVKYRLKGVSDYGTEVDEIYSTDKNGNIQFKNVEKGNYILQEYESTNDWLLDSTEHSVLINDEGDLYINNELYTNIVYELTDKPRIHGDVTIIKKREGDSVDSVEFKELLHGAEINSEVEYDGKIYKILEKTATKVRVDEIPQGEAYAIEGYWISTEIKPQSLIPDTKFKLSGVSDYGNDVLEYAISDIYGRLNFNNIELGTYTLEETNANEDYILNKTKWVVKVNEQGNISIAEPDENDLKDRLSRVDNLGNVYAIYNEPRYWDFSLRKVDSENETIWIEGAEFTLTGISDLGTEYNEVKMSDQNGKVEFSKIEKGSYVLKETKAPQGVDETGKFGGTRNYVADPREYVVKIDNYGNTIIDGLYTNEYDDFVVKNDRSMDGEIVVIKKWEDSKTESERPTPVVHLAYNENDSFHGIKVIKKWQGDTQLIPNEFNVRLLKYSNNELVESIESQNDRWTKTENGWQYIFDITVDENCEYYVEEDAKAYYVGEKKIKVNDKRIGTLFNLIDNNKKYVIYPASLSGTPQLPRLYKQDPAKTASLHFYGEFRDMDEYYKDSLRKYVEPGETFYLVARIDSYRIGSGGGGGNGTVWSETPDYSVTKWSQSYDISSLDFINFSFHISDSLTTDTSKDVRIEAVDRNGNRIMSYVGGPVNLGPRPNFEPRTQNGVTLEVDNPENVKTGYGGYTLKDIKTYTAYDAEPMITYTNNNGDVIYVFNQANLFARESDEYINIGKYLINEQTEMVTDSTINMSGIFNMLGIKTVHAAANDVIKTGTYNGITYKIIEKSDSTYELILGNGRTQTYNGQYTNHKDYPWYNYKEKITSVKTSGKINATGSLKYMFYYFTNCTTFNLSNFNTTNVTNMEYVFYFCSKVTSLNLRGFNTSNVIDMSGMFSNCRKLTTLDLSSFNTSNVIDMSNMFNSCKSLKSLDLSNFNTSNVTTMGQMFSNCESLTTLDLSSFNTTNNTSMQYMFKDCLSLSSLDLSNFNTSNIKNGGMIEMFSGAYNIEFLDLSSFDFSNQTTSSSGATSILAVSAKKIKLSQGTCPEKTFNGLYYNVSTGTTLNNSTTSYKAGIYERNLLRYVLYDTGEIVLQAGETTQPEKGNVVSITEGIPSNYEDINKVTVLVNMMPNLRNLSLDSVDFGPFDGTNLEYKYVKNCFSRLKIKKLEIKNWDLTHLKDLKQFFYNAAIDELIVDGVKVPNDLGEMFYGSNIKDVKLNFANGMNINSAIKMFYNSTIESVDLGVFGKTFSTARLKSLFSGCSYLKFVNIKDMGQITNTSANSLFSDCNNIETIYIPTYMRASPNNYLNLLNKQWHFVYSTIDDTIYDYDAADIKNTSELISSFSNQTGGIWTTNREFDVKKYLGIVDPEYVSDNECWERIDNFTYKCIIPVFDDTIRYKIYEEYMDGYTSDIMNPKYDYFNEDGSKMYVITNKNYDTGSLKIRKYVQDITTTKKFDFTVTLRGESIQGTQIFGGVIFEDGVGKIKLSHGEEKIITGIPENTTYTIEEDVYINYATESEGSVGVIAKDTISEVEFINTYEDMLDKNPEKYRDIVIRKAVEGNYETSNEYTFYISMSNLDVNYDYEMSNGEMFTSDENGDANITMMLSDKEEVIIKNLPVGSYYQITEEAGEYVSSYNIEIDGQGSVNQTSEMSTSENQQLSTSVEQVDADEVVIITFTNKLKKKENVKISKSVEGTELDKKAYYEFVVELAGLEPFGKYDTSIGRFVADEDGLIQKEFRLTDGETIQIDDLPVGSTYRITEKASTLISSYEIVNANDKGSISLAERINEKNNSDLSTEIETVNEGEDITILFKNKRNSAILTLKKLVDGNMGNKVEKFEFTVIVDGVNVQTYTLGHEDIENIELPLNTEYEIVENDYSESGYRTYVNNNIYQSRNEFGVLTEDTEIVFRNIRGAAVPTEIRFWWWAGIPLVLGPIAWFVFKKRKQHID